LILTKRERVIVCGQVETMRNHVKRFHKAWVKKKDSKHGPPAYEKEWQVTQIHIRYPIYTP
jgi:hypothetical protein